MQASIKLPRLAAVICLAAFCVACVPGAGVRPAAGPDGLESRAAALADRGEHSAAARAWEEAAARAPQSRANRLWLAAARSWLAAGDPEAVRRSLTRLTEPLADPDLRERTRLQAELAIRDRQPQRALALLAGPGMILDAPALATRARAQFALGEIPAAVTTLVTRAGLLRGRAELLANERMIVDGVAAAAQRGSDVRPRAGTEPVVAGWLELGRIQSNAAATAIGAGSQLQAWRQRYPAHPANAGLWQELVERYSTRIEPSSRIALLLPLSGKARAAGLAVQDGFLSAYYDQPTAERPEIKVYDVAASDAATAYLAAVTGGAQVVVGPLTREEVGNLAMIADSRTTTVALNFLPDGTRTPPRFYQFALSPEDEARQSARRAVADGRPGGVALVPATEWGQRVLAAFAEELAAAGGSLRARSVYAPGTTDFRDIINGLLELRPAQTPEGRPTRVYRQDAQFIFVAAQPVTGRLIRTQLRFNFAGRLPVYSTSDVYEPGGSGNNDLDGVIFPDMPWVVDALGPVAALREGAAAAWPQHAANRSRLYAFGYDAYAIVAELGRRQAPFGTPVPGLTGRLSLDSFGRIRRELQFVRVSGGRAEPWTAGGTATEAP